MKKKIIPVRRDLKVSLPEDRVCDWHHEGGHVTHFFNALSLLFPAGCYRLPKNAFIRRRYMVVSAGNETGAIKAPECFAAQTQYQNGSDSDLVAAPSSRSRRMNS